MTGTDTWPIRIASFTMTLNDFQDHAPIA